MKEDYETDDDELSTTLPLKESNDNDLYNKKEYNIKLVRILTILYCRSVCSDFRRPVEILYPFLMVEYKNSIQYPMDLGTLLLKCMQGNESINNIRFGLKLVFSNALSFNKGVHQMESISYHLNHFSGSLFEDILNIKYSLPTDKFFNKTINNDNNIKERNIKQRSKRILSIKDEPLLFKEIKEISKALNGISTITVPTIISSTVTNLHNNMNEILANNNINNDKNEIITITNIFYSFLQSIIKDINDVSNTKLVHVSNLPSLFNILLSNNENNNINNNDEIDINKEYIEISIINASILAYINAIDDCISDSMICLTERFLRGIHELIINIHISIYILQFLYLFLTLYQSHNNNSLYFL
jgi:hypothetical protein